MESRGGFDLPPKIRGRAEQEPSVSGRADGHLGLSASLTRESSCAHTAAIAAGAVPLRKSTPGGGAEGSQKHSRRLEFRAGVGVNFAVQANFFKTWLGPFHDRHPTLKDLRLNFDRNRGPEGAAPSPPKAFRIPLMFPQQQALSTGLKAGAESQISADCRPDSRVTAVTQTRSNAFGFQRRPCHWQWSARQI
jgi:hypothetical protein